MHNLRKYISGLIDLSESGWSLLTTCMTEMEFRKNEVLLNEGEICRSIFFISSGLCKSCYLLDGREVNTAFYFENDFATNITSLTTSAKSGHEIKAIEKTRVIRLEKRELLEAYAESHEIEAFGRKVLEQIVARQEEHVNSFKLLTARQRFDDLVQKHPDFLQRVSLTQIASYLGISRETLSRFRGRK